jgi:ATP-dependent DNA helicase RecQ
VKVAWTPRDHRHKLLRFIQAQKTQTGLVYARTRRDVEELVHWLEQQGLKTAAYHAGLSSERRRTLENSWLSGELSFVVSTSAFGMGINKPDVGWVVHFQPPLLLSEYIQEIGRAGRDGRMAEVLLLKSESTGWLDPSDQHRHQFLTKQLQKQQRDAQALIKQLPSQGDVRVVSYQFPNSEHALASLHSVGYLRWVDPFHYELTPPNPRTPTLAPRNGISTDWSVRIALHQMTQYLTTNECRWKFLLQSFGFTKEANSIRCGHCDNCAKTMV